MNPEGKFVVDTQHDLQRDHYFFAGGSGITPVMSMIISVLEEEPKSNIYLLYCNRNEGSIIFNDRLNELAENHKGQFSLRHILSQPDKKKSKGIKGLLGKKESKWSGWKGRIDGKILKKFLEENPSKTSDSNYYLCGPGGLIESVENYLKNNGVDAARISREFFTNPDQKDKATSAQPVEGGDCQAEVTLNGDTFIATIPSGKTVLEALMELGKDPPYSCTSGACSTCVAKVAEGEVEMDVCFALDDDEVKSGYVLTCQSRPKTSNLKLTFEN
jgi:ring-1,2-phenylacetyl-CoA epoxidase subunit PaaE